MNTTMHKALSSLGWIATMATLAACGGKAGYDAPSAYPSDEAAGYGQPAPEGIAAEPGTASEEGADFDGGGADDARPAPPPAQPSRDSAAREKSADDPFELETQPRNRPGLATQWGEQRFSRVTTAPFIRAEREQPFAMGTVFYNDPEGIRAMSDTNGGSRQHMRRFAVGAGHVELGLRDGSGRFLTGFEANGQNFVTGIAGRRYTIVVKNHSPGRIEAVVSVDGLDVIDGKPASFAKRGYLIDPHGDLEIDGFRTSNSEVAAFRFGSVRNSYANKKHGDTRNVGVIGMAVFHERGDSPRFWGTPRTNRDVRDRGNANPFPQQFASPPN